MEYCSRIVLVEKGAEFFSTETMELLKLIDEMKSVKEAASTLKISSARAWKLIRATEKYLGESAVVKSRTEGVDGYRVHISPACRGLLEKYAEFNVKSQAAVKEIFDNIF